MPRDFRLAAVAAVVLAGQVAIAAPLAASLPSVSWTASATRS